MYAWKLFNHKRVIPEIKLYNKRGIVYVCGQFSLGCNFQIKSDNDFIFQIIWHAHLVLSSEYN